MQVISKRDAKAAGLSRYFTGRACVRGHVVERYISGTCVECGLVKCREWYSRNLESQRARASAYRNANIETARAKSEIYNQANLPRLAAIARNRRARQRNNGGSHTALDVANILSMQKGKCAYCRIVLESKYHVDHVMPLALGGSNGRQNLQILCVSCNKTKSAKHPIAFAQSRGLLL